MKSPKYYWLIGVAIIILLSIGYSIADYSKSSDDTAEAIETAQLVDSRMAIVDKNATARSVINNMLIDDKTKITVISGTSLALSDYVLAYSNEKKYRGYLDLTHLTPSEEASYVLWSKSPEGDYKRIRVFPPDVDFLQYNVPVEGHTMIITLEPGGAGSQPNLQNVIAEEQVEK